MLLPPTTGRWARRVLRERVRSCSVVVFVEKFVLSFLVFSPVDSFRRSPTFRLIGALTPPKVDKTTRLKRRSQHKCLLSVILLDSSNFLSVFSLVVSHSEDPPPSSALLPSLPSSLLPVRSQMTLVRWIRAAAAKQVERCVFSPCFVLLSRR
jgi:hypothetical protein